MTTVGPENFRSILGKVFSIYQRNFFKLVGIATMVEIPRLALYALVNGAIMYTVERVSVTNLVTVSKISPPVITFILGVFVYPLMAGAMIRAISEQSLKQTIGIRRSYRFAWSRLRTMIIAEILLGLAIVGLTITVIGIPFAIYLAVRWVFIGQSILLEGASSRYAFSRSSDLVRGNWWRVLGFMFVVGIIGAISGFVLRLIPFGAIIGTILLTPIGLTTLTVLYYDLRIRKEGKSFEAWQKNQTLRSTITLSNMAP